MEATIRLTADVVLLATKDDTLHVLMIERAWAPFEGCLALPGGHVDDGETDEAAARRELREETGLHAEHLQRVDVYTEPGRDPRGRYVTVAYVAVLPELVPPTAGDDARAATWVRVDDVLAEPAALAFDHSRILADAIAHVRATAA